MAVLTTKKRKALKKNSSGVALSERYRKMISEDEYGEFHAKANKIIKSIAKK